MFVYDNRQDVRKSARFDVMQAFMRLDDTRKLALFDKLDEVAPGAFDRTVNLFWPQANRVDAQRLRSYMSRRVAANDRY